ncbi:serine/arginine-rich splicing factor 7-like [Argiope bruennichi]|uniref:serine/arginine-rich splicing factor 7-like n=1 Tax=Argiope bruennichi TaxID=94029 RepID=UPI002494ADEC|nr:serine/arginine-rich splicing factor 7-like [Argiope bruennichi]
MGQSNETFDQDPDSRKEETCSPNVVQESTEYADSIKYSIHDLLSNQTENSFLRNATNNLKTREHSRQRSRSNQGSGRRSSGRRKSRTNSQTRRGASGRRQQRSRSNSRKRSNSRRSRRRSRKQGSQPRNGSGRSRRGGKTTPMPDPSQDPIPSTASKQSKKGNGQPRKSSGRGHSGAQTTSKSDFSSDTHPSPANALPEDKEE